MHLLIGELESLVDRNHQTALQIKARLAEIRIDMTKRGVIDRNAASAQMERNLYEVYFDN